MSKRLVTIKVNAKGLGTAVDVKPFIVYQFYTCDKYYSSDGTAVKDKHDWGTKSFEIEFDDKAIDYFSSEDLEISFFNDIDP